jgi:Spy/CpxP family protein refolding chaperone
MERAFGVLGRWWNNPRIVERMKLTDEQRKEFDDIFLAHREKLIDLRASLQKAELALEPLMREDPPKEAKILAQIDKVAQARAELEKANGSFLLAIRSKLTTEQWKQLQADRASEGQGPGGWRQGGPYRRLAPPPAAEPPAPPAPPPGAEQ